MSKLFNALTIAGSDSSGGAGIQADIKAFSANGVYGMSIITAITAQNTQGVFGIMDVTPEIIEKQIEVIFNDIEVIYTSNYVRTIETAKYISENNNIKINILDELGERRFGISSWSEKPKDFERRQFLDENYKIGDGENKKEVEERMYDCILKILKENKNKTIAIVSHATAISYLLNKWCNIKIEDNMLSYKYNNKEILKGPINYCETLKLTFDIENNLKNIEKI